jgi:hypothetical protein
MRRTHAPNPCAEPMRRTHAPSRSSACPTARHRRLETFSQHQSGPQMPNSDVAIGRGRNASQAGGVSACRHWITIAPRRKSSKPSRKAKTVQSARPYSRVSPKATSGWLASKKIINGKSGKRPGLIPPARPAGPARADIRFHGPSARYISPQDAACAAIRWRMNGYPGCTILHPLPISRACRPTTVPHRLIGCWRHRNSSALCSVENQPARSGAPPDHLIAAAVARHQRVHARLRRAMASVGGSLHAGYNRPSPHRKHQLPAEMPALADAVRLRRVGKLEQLHLRRLHRAGHRELRNPLHRRARARHRRAQSLDVRA